MASSLRGPVVDALGRLFESGTAAGLGDAQLVERFLALGDESAFEAILHRHGPMVHGVCRRVLDDPHDIADAFQATFLVLVKKARSIRDRDALGTWLHGVARRVAVRARVDSRRRGARERTGLDAGESDVETAPDRSRPDRLEIQELRATLDDEIGRLPSRYRSALVLCDLEGRSCEQAAAQLGCAVGTVKSRLSRGRERLRSRLARRGVAPGAGLLAATLAGSAQAVPVELLSQTIGAARRIVAGQAIAAGASSAGAAALTKGVLRTMLFAQIRTAAAVLMAAALATTGVRALVAPAAGPVPQEAEAPRVQSPPKPEPAPPEKGVERFRLANGLRVILRPIKGSAETAMVVVYDIGEDHDPEGHSGLGHAIEHLYLTAAAGETPARTAEEFQRQYPGGWNGQTGTRYTLVSTAFPADRLDRELGDAAARMAGSKVTAADLARERPRLLDEVANMFERFPALSALNNARDRARPMPAGGRHGGQPEFLRSVTLDEIRARLDRYYKPVNATLALAGDFDPAAARRAIESRFGAIPAGEPIPPPREPGPPNYFVSVRPRTVPADDEGEGRPIACLAYPAPQPGSDLYPAFLVLIARLWAAGQGFEDGGITGSPVFFTPLDDGTVVAISATLRPGETPAKAFERIEAFVADAIGDKLEAGETDVVSQQLGMILGLADVPDQLLGNNPYGVAFSLARRDQLGLVPARLKRALADVKEADLRRAAATVFDKGRHAGAVAGVGETRP